jgi:DNA-3-methyladenine glycosylase II
MSIEKFINLGNVKNENNRRFNVMNIEYGINKKNFTWEDYVYYIDLIAPKEFSFEQCMVYLNRSEDECLHRVKGNELYKMVNYEDTFYIFKMSSSGKNIRVSFLNKVPIKEIKARIAQYIWEMFDFGTDLTLFYHKAKKDEILSLLVDKYYGLRIIKMDDVFEGLCWAVIGQQINLKFAYTLKKRLVEKYGESLAYEDETYFLFPTPEIISQLKVEDLKALHFTARKAEYVIGIAKLFHSGVISKEGLMKEKEYEVLANKLVEIRGVGNWTADYTILKCFNLNCAFPIADVGVHNALKAVLNLKEKPTIDTIEKLSKGWQGWEAYATFYLWRVLYD